MTDLEANGTSEKQDELMEEESQDTPAPTLPCTQQAPQTMSSVQQKEITCPNIGKVNVTIQGHRSPNEVVIFTVHDLGCNHTMYNDFVTHPRMSMITNRTVWVHVDVPGQEPGAPDLPAGYQFPTMQNLAADLVTVLDELQIKQVVCFGEGAGANILARFAMQNDHRVLGIVLIHCTGTTATFLESLRDKVINWKLDHIGMNPTAEAYLVLHRFGSGKEFSSAESKEQLQKVIENFQDNLRTKVNPKNLKRFVEAYIKRTSISEHTSRIRCPVLMVTGAKASFNRTTRNLQQTMMKNAEDKKKLEYVEVEDVANVMEEKPEKLVESFQYFLQGLGFVSSIPMHHVERRPIRARTMSMEEYDTPKLRSSSMSGTSPPNESPLSASPPRYVNAVQMSGSAPK